MSFLTISSWLRNSHLKCAPISHQPQGNIGTSSSSASSSATVSSTRALHVSIPEGSAAQR
jgi:hypothetical protein